MSEPNFIVSLSERTLSGSLFTTNIQEIKKVLRGQGMILLPSDTCYSLAALATSRDTYKTINAVLNRNDIPISLAFPHLTSVQDYVDLHLKSATLLETFTPGAITVVCKGKSKFPKAMIEDIVRSKDGTFGIRIPDSIVEREVAACANFPVTTVAIRDEKGEIVQDFTTALKIVMEGAKNVPGFVWAAIEGSRFFHRNSTVVRVDDATGQIDLLRAGEIPFDTILEASTKIPSSAYDD